MTDPLREIGEILRRRRPGYMSFCVSIDLLGVRHMLTPRPREAAARLNDLHVALAEAIALFPGPDRYRACFVGDSWYLVREVSPEEDVSTEWAAFCGHLFALSSLVWTIESDLGNPGIRAIAAQGQLTPLDSLDSWRHKHIREETQHWFVLTGVDLALAKSEHAQRLGGKHGFRGNLFWHEVVDQPGRFWGTPFRAFTAAEVSGPGKYADVYHEMCKTHTHEAALPPVEGE